MAYLFYFWLSMFVPMQVRIPGPGGAIPVAPTIIGPVDALIDMNTSSPGTTLTTTILGNGTQGGGNFVSPWALSATPGMTVEAHQTGCTQGGTVRVNGTDFATSHTSQSIKYDHVGAPKTAGLSFNGGIRRASYLGCITFGPPDVGAGSAGLFDYVTFISASGGNVVVQLNNGNCGGSAVYGVNIETNPGGTTTHSSCITLTPGGTYWVMLQADYIGGTSSMDIYTTSFSLVGSVTSTQSTGADISVMRIGSNETSTSSGNFSYFENQLVQYSGGGVYPLGPTNTTYSVPYIVSKAAGNGSGGSTTIASAATNLQAGNLSLAFVSSETSGSTISSCTDTAGNTYASDASLKVSLAGQAQIEAWYAKNTTANSSNVVTCTYSGSSVFRAIQVIQIAGASTSAPFDVGATGTASAGSGTVTTGSFTPSVTASCLIGGHITSGTIMTSGTNYYGIYSSTNSYASSMRPSCPASSQTASMTSSSTASKVATVIALKP